MHYALHCLVLRYPHLTSTFPHPARRGAGLCSVSLFVYSSSVDLRTRTRRASLFLSHTISFICPKLNLPFPFAFDDEPNMCVCILSWRGVGPFANNTLGIAMNESDNVCFNLHTKQHARDNKETYLQLSSFGTQFSHVLFGALIDLVISVHYRRAIEEQLEVQ